MRATAVFHARFWHTLDWKNVLLLLVALCIIGFDLLGKMKVRQYSLGRAVNQVEAARGPEEELGLPPASRWSSSEASISWKTTRAGHSVSLGIDAPLEMVPPPGYVVTRVVPAP